MSFDLKKYLADGKERIDCYMKETWFSGAPQDPTSLHESMRYSLFAPGKRIRPILTLASADALNIPTDDVLPIATSLEMIHVFSLIHDDLPAMDDDDLRRGQPTNHKKFGEAIAILAGDNLLSTAFVPLASLNTEKYSAKNILTLIKMFALSTGHEGMISGQVIDMESQGKQIDLERLKKLHRHKTGALIRLAVEAPAVLAGVSEDIHKKLVSYGEAVGLAFQIADDILDIEGGADLGKDIGSDIENGKATYPALMGLDGAKKAAQETLQQALDVVACFGDRAEPLQELARFIVNRKS